MDFPIFLWNRHMDMDWNRDLARDGDQRKQFSQDICRIAGRLPVDIRWTQIATPSLDSVPVPVRREGRDFLLWRREFLFKHQ